MSHKQHGPRILAGRFRGRQLKVPPGKVTRPARARVRQTVFDILQGEILDAAWLDLFAGSGSFGIEALSRGARHCTFVENGPAGVRALSDNLARLDLRAPEAVLLRARLPELLLARPPSGAPFDRISLDPPFALCRDPRGLQGLVDALDEAAAGGWFSADAVVIWEEPSDAPAPTPKRIPERDVRHFGTSRVRFFQLP